jgi:hypothetical protein
MRHTKRHFLHLCTLLFSLLTSYRTLDFAKIEHEHKRCLQFLISLMQSVAGRGSLAHRKIICYS